MNTYVLIARHISKVSGEKIYTYNKLEYMLSLGWRVLYITGNREQIPEKLSGCKHLVYSALTYAPECYSRPEVRRTVESIAAEIGTTGGDVCILESDAVNRAVWAELIAKRIEAKHLAFLLQEIHNYNEETKKFLRFKYLRHELAGIAVQSINQILGDDGAERREDTKISAFCNNAVENCTDTISAQLEKEAACTLGSIGRLDKGCVSAILKGFRAYASLHPQQRFNVVLIGGAMGKKRVGQVREEMRDCKNVHLIITGYLYPIPESLLDNIDVFVSAAGSASPSYRYHRPTIRVHPVTGEPAGIMGLDELEGKSMYDVLSGTTIEDCISRALANADRIRYTFNKYDDYYEKMYAEFARQLSFKDAGAEKAYYDEDKLLSIQTTHIKGHFWHRLVGHVAGAGGLDAFVRVYKSLT